MLIFSVSFQFFFVCKRGKVAETCVTEPVECILFGPRTESGSMVTFNIVTPQDADQGEYLFGKICSSVPSSMSQCHDIIRLHYHLYLCSDTFMVLNHLSFMASFSSRLKNGCFLKSSLKPVIVYFVHGIPR